MTKLFEQYILITLRDLPLENLVEKGEYTLILQGVEKGLSPESLDWKKEVLLRVSSDKAWSKEMGLRHGISPKLVYDTVLYERRKK